MKLIDIELLCRVCERNGARIVTIVTVDESFTRVLVESGVRHRRIQKYLDTLFFVGAGCTVMLMFWTKQNTLAIIGSVVSTIVTLVSHCAKMWMNKYRPPKTPKEIMDEFAREVRAYHEGAVTCDVDARGTLLFRDRQ